MPELWVQDVTDLQAQIYPLLGDRDILGRSSQSDIVVRNPVVSQTHLTVSRDSRKNGWLPNPFWIQDEGSTNGIYRGKARITGAELRHNAVYTLGPPDLEGCVRLQYIESAALVSADFPLWCLWPRWIDRDRPAGHPDRVAEILRHSPAPLHPRPSGGLCGR